MIDHVCINLDFVLGYDMTEKYEHRHNQIQLFNQRSEVEKYWLMIAVAIIAMWVAIGLLDVMIG